MQTIKNALTIVKLLQILLFLVLFVGLHSPVLAGGGCSTHVAEEPLLPQDQTRITGEEAASTEALRQLGLARQAIDLGTEFKTKALTEAGQADYDKGNFVTFTGEELESMKIRVREQVISIGSERLHCINGRHPYIYVMDANGDIYISTRSMLSTLGFGHPAFLNGAPVAGAGEICFNEGIITQISNISGHYLPPAELLWQVVAKLNTMGIQSNFLIVVKNEDRTRTSYNFSN